MRRDDDLIRTLMLNIERQHEGESLWGSAVAPIGEDPQVVGEHLNLLHEAGFLRGHYRQMLEDTYVVPSNFQIDGLSWQGHEFLNTIRDNNVWNATKQRLSKVGGSVSISIVSEVAATVAKNLLGLPG